MSEERKQGRADTKIEGKRSKLIHLAIRGDLLDHRHAPPGTDRARFAVIARDRLNSSAAAKSHSSVPQDWAASSWSRRSARHRESDEFSVRYLARASFA